MKSNCVLCDSQIDEETSLCDGCRHDLPEVVHACKSCALPIAVESENNYCGHCLSQENAVDYAMTLFRYVNPVDYLINQMKFQQQLTIAAVLADLLKAKIEKSILEYGLPDLILPMPLHTKRLTKRGFNQSLEISKPLANSLSVPIELNLVTRSKETKAQMNLNKNQRHKNVSGCFSMIAKTEASHIVIVDDVVTTGATTNELAKLLKKSGVDKVGVWSLARAELH